MRSAVFFCAAVLAGCDAGNGASPPVDSGAASPSAAITPPLAPGPTAVPVQQPTLVDTDTMKFTARGTEPFWSVSVQRGQLRYLSPDQPEGVAFAATATRSGSGYRYAGTLATKPVTLVIAPGRCSDGMSETVYAYTAALTIGAQALRGCAEAN